MHVNAQLHALAALSQGKTCGIYRIGGWVGWGASEPVWTPRREENIPFAEHRTLNIQDVARLLPKILSACTYGFKYSGVHALKCKRKLNL
jgi:hypothetical protein